MKIYLLSLAFLVFPYCLAGRSQIIPELETQPIFLSLPPSSRENSGLEPQFVQIEDLAINETSLVLPRIGATFQSGPEAGYRNSFGSLYTFVPFTQVPGRSTFYTEGRVNFFHSRRGFWRQSALRLSHAFTQKQFDFGGLYRWRCETDRI